MKNKKYLLLLLLSLILGCNKNLITSNQETNEPSENISMSINTPEGNIKMNIKTTDEEVSFSIQKKENRKEEKWQEDI